MLITKNSANRNCVSVNSQFHFPLSRLQTGSQTANLVFRFATSGKRKANHRLNLQIQISKLGVVKCRQITILGLNSKCL